MTFETSLYQLPRRSLQLIDSVMISNMHMTSKTLFFLVELYTHYTYSHNNIFPADRVKREPQRKTNPQKVILRATVPVHIHNRNVQRHLICLELTMANISKKYIWRPQFTIAAWWLRKSQMLTCKGVWTRYSGILKFGYHVQRLGRLRKSNLIDHLLNPFAKPKSKQCQLAIFSYLW